MKGIFKGGTKMTGGVKPPAPNPPVISGNPKVVKSAKGQTHFADGGVVTGKKTAMRLDRPGRKMGGRVGADCAPLSSAAATTGRDDGKQSN
jgi:hypothetical protein